jgi:7,8-dihydropterin-6-yl-methyl-4-(beta-D-ribofuranosyl)aminobenzene 5'-phosphate synthase
MRIITLIENLVYQKGLVAEHGLSFYIEIDGMKFLFDTGQGKNFILNAHQLGIDISAIDKLIISHGHFDHAGGINDFLKENIKASVIMKREALYPKYSGKLEIGVEHDANLPIDRIEFIESARQLSESLFVMPTITSYFPIDSHKKGFSVQVDGAIVPDPFDDELFLCIRNAQRLIVISSCSHNGITNILETAKKSFNKSVSEVIGGFHVRESTLEEKRHIANYLNYNEVESIGICHCTGIETYNYLKGICQGNVYYNCTGNKINLT